MADLHSAALIAVIAGVTILLRFLPFWIFGSRREPPAFVLYLGKVLPFAIMGMLLVYCLRGINLTAAPFGAPELLATALVAGLHILKGNSLLSILAGTVFYMVLVQGVW